MKRILIIEDEAPIAMLQRDYFELHSFSVECAFTGQDGLTRALHNDYDLIIIDLQLPILDGFELCRQLREQKDVPILIVSAKQEEVDKIRAFNLGADDYITKPFSPSELVARAKAHLNRYERLINKQQDRSKEELVIRGIRIDRASRRVYVREDEVSFTTKEFDLLAFLVQHPNRVFSKEELFEHIWGMDSSGDIATVTVHVRKLREKLEVDPSNPQYLETVWGAGYRFTV